jgi:hypothetical protein
MPDNIIFVHPHAEDYKYMILLVVRGENIHVYYSCSVSESSMITFPTQQIFNLKHILVTMEPLLHNMINEFTNVMNITSKNYFFIRDISMIDFIEQIKFFEGLVEKGSCSLKNNMFSFSIDGIQYCVGDIIPNSLPFHSEKIISSIDAIIPIEAQREFKLNQII